MKKTLLVLASIGLAGTLQAQCPTTSAPTNNGYYGDAIDSFVLNGVATTGNFGSPTNGYNSFTTPVRTLTLGGTYSFSADVGGGYYDEGLAIWIDLNNDGNYANTEQVYASTIATFAHTGNITIPFTAAVANNIKMRVRCAYDIVIPNSDACTNNIGNFGETEDYLINIVCPASSNVTIANTNTFLCQGQSATLTASGAQAFSWTGGITNGVSFIPTSTTSYTVTGTIPACPSASGTAVKTISVTNVPLTIIANANPTVICVGSQASLNAAGASNFTWSASNQTLSTILVSPSASTVYTVVGYNGSGCPGTATISLSVNPIPSLSVATTGTAVCEGNSATITASGASSYTWTQGPVMSPSIVVTPTASTLYIVTGINNVNCTSTANVVVVLNPSPTFNATTNKPVVCTGGGSTLIAAPASGADTYSWNTSALSSSTTVNTSVSTVYSVTGTYTQTGCTSTKTVLVTVFQPVLTISPASATACANTVVSFTATGGGTYSWMPGNGGFAVFDATATVPTTYSVSSVATSSGITCPALGTVFLAVNPNPTVTAGATKTLACKGEKIILTATGAPSYSWSTANAITNTVQVAPVTNTVISVTGTDANNCVSTASIELKINNCTGLEKVAALANAGLLIYPNPNHGAFSVQAASEMELELINELGQFVNKILLNKSNGYEAHVSGLIPGIYFIKGQDESLQISERIIVTK